MENVKLCPLNDFAPCTDQCVLWIEGDPCCALAITADFIAGLDEGVPQ